MAINFSRSAIMENEITAPCDGETFDKRGSVLLDAHKVINGQRQDVYGNPEYSFALIAEYWAAYLTGRKGNDYIIKVSPKDVAMMMVLFKTARLANGVNHRDSYVDCAGYLGLAADIHDKQDAK
jgi:hypothetical protein